MGRSPDALSITGTTVNPRSAACRNFTTDSLEAMRWLTAFILLVTACSPGAAPSTSAVEPPTSTTAESTTTITAPPTTSTTTTTLPDPFEPPSWLGTRVLPLRADGFGEVTPTPPELVDRAFATPDLLPPPGGEDFVGAVSPVPDDVLARSTWTADCPVTREELAYLTVSHWGFDGKHHTGELIVNARHAEAVLGVFARLHDVRFPIEEMRVIRADELDLPPTGDGNVTTGFVCRPVVGSTSWSMHASGEAIDINPFHNPYVKGDLVLPELASAFTDRSNVRPGMITEGDTVVRSFDDIGWQWGGRWTSLTDPMHFSTTGR